MGIQAPVVRIDYQELCVLLYAYHFGTIGFLDLLVRFEEILGIKLPP